jgi:hypothetical protein
MACAAIGFGKPADAAPVQFGSNYYEFVPSEAITWSDASAAASGDVFQGMQGHLATVTSSAENDFIQSLVAPAPFFYGAWLGGAVDAMQQARWAVGPEAGQLFTFSNFGAGEPDDGPSNVYMNIGSTYAGIATGQWVDAAGGHDSVYDRLGGYFVEYESVSQTPLPAALPLMLTGLAGLGAAGWRRKRTTRTPSAA